MSKKQLVTTLLLGVLAWIAVLGVFVFIDEPHLIGHPAPHVTVADLVYLAFALLLVAAAVYTPLRLLVAELRDDGSEPTG